MIKFLEERVREDLNLPQENTVLLKLKVDFISKAGAG